MAAPELRSVETHGGTLPPAVPHARASIIALPGGSATRARAWGWRSVLVFACAAAGLAAAGLGDPAPYVRADAELARLLRAMAVLKAVMVAPALAVLLWRFRWPVSLRLGSAYVFGAVMMVGASVLIWGLVHLGAAAVLFHAGAAILIAAAFLDRSRDARRPAVRRRLATARPTPRSHRRTARDTR